MEQRAKQEWEETHFGDSNPYSDLPEMRMYTYDLGKLIKGDFVDVGDKAFNFAEFFRTDDNGNFVHEKNVNDFLNLLTKQDKYTMPIMVSLLRGDIYKTEYGSIYMGLTLTVVPLIIVYLLLSKYIIAGVALGGVKS